MRRESGLALPGALDSDRLPNGLEVHLLRNSDAPVVTTALTYRAGARHEPAGRSGLAHFLEHMMFKGSARFESGEIDRLTRSLGGSNNAFTTHDSTTYFFSFAAGKAAGALEIEADRMQELVHTSDEVDRERAVILEEMAMYEAEPWEALDRRVQSELFGAHPYGRPIIGLREEVEATTGRDLEDFHRRLYDPSNAVLVVAGAIDRTVEEGIGRLFGSLAGNGVVVGADEAPRPLGRHERVLLRRGSVDRFLLAFPTPRLERPDFPALRLICSLLGGGRSGILNDRLVERSSLCTWVSCSLTEGELGGALYVAAEVVPGSDAGRVEATILEEIERLRRGEADVEALERARRMIEADWVFAHERIESQALTLSQAAAGVGPGYPESQMRALAALGAADVHAAAGRYLDPAQGSVLGWSRAVAG